MVEAIREFMTMPLPPWSWAVFGLSRFLVLLSVSLCLGFALRFWYAVPKSWELGIITFGSAVLCFYFGVQIFVIETLRTVPMMSSCVLHWGMVLLSLGAQRAAARIAIPYIRLRRFQRGR